MTKVKILFFILVEGGSQTVQRGWPMVMVQIQFFNFNSRGETT
jgi:hypothetical protein